MHSPKNISCHLLLMNYFFNFTRKRIKLLMSKKGGLGSELFSSLFCANRLSYFMTPELDLIQQTLQPFDVKHFDI